MRTNERPHVIRTTRGDGRSLTRAAAPRAPRAAARGNQCDARESGFIVILVSE